MPSYQGGCHCGHVRFEIRKAQPIKRLISCDCSICTKKGILHVAAQDEEFTLLKGERSLSLYQFKSNTAKHWFCGHCGIHAFGRPRNSPGRYTVNARCLDNFDDIIAEAEIHEFDGRNHPKDRTA